MTVYHEVDVYPYTGTELTSRRARLREAASGFRGGDHAKPGELFLPGPERPTKTETEDELGSPTEWELGN